MKNGSLAGVAGQTGDSANEVIVQRYVGTTASPVAFSIAAPC